MFYVTHASIEVHSSSTAVRNDNVFVHESHAKHRIYLHCNFPDRWIPLYFSKEHLIGIFRNKIYCYIVHETAFWLLSFTNPTFDANSSAIKIKFTFYKSFRSIKTF